MRDLQGRTTPEHDVNLNKNLWAAQEIGIAYLSIAPLRNLSKFTSFWFPLHWPLRMSVPSPLPLSGDVPAGLGPGGALGAATAKALAKPHAAEARRRRSLVFLLRTQTCPLVLIGKDHLFWVVGPKGEVLQLRSVRSDNPIWLRPPGPSRCFVTPDLRPMCCEEAPLNGLLSAYADADASPTTAGEVADAGAVGSSKPVAAEGDEVCRPKTKGPRPTVWAGRSWSDS